MLRETMLALGGKVWHGIVVVPVDVMLAAGKTVLVQKQLKEE